MKLEQHNKAVNAYLNKVFGYFLSQKGVNPKFTKTKYGYRTYDSVWKFYLNSFTITKTEYEKEYNGFEHISVCYTSKYMLVAVDGKSTIRFISKIKNY